MPSRLRMREQGGIALDYTKFAVNVGVHYTLDKCSMAVSVPIESEFAPNLPFYIA